MKQTPAIRYEPVAVGGESTVVAEYTATYDAAATYQSETELEQDFITVLRAQEYEYLRIASEADLIANLRSQLETLNGIVFTDNEWKRFFQASIAGANDSIEDKTARIQEDHIQSFIRDDGTTKNVALIDMHNIHNNRVQVINQYEVGQETARYANRYDVTILVNGLPMVHVELKRRGVDLREAFNQIDRYQRDSFWAGSGLFDYVQIFVISNGTLTKYYANTTRRQHLAEAQSRRHAKKTSNSFEFTSWWADAANKPITDLMAFAQTFFARHTILSILTKYCVFTSEHLLLVMRPYQIAATERILQRIATATNYKQLGKKAAGGYIWHTTGSGKTLTSFKTAQLATKMPGVTKVLFVVDRKDLDYQTMKEYDKFQKGAANSNTSTRILKKQLEDPNARIIITTIQKLTTFVSATANAGHTVYGDHIVIIFDECHRSQFGDMHKAITRAFKRYHLFGFTGTPIFADNAPRSSKLAIRTTEQAFGDRLHTYTIVDAINDKNVLPFRVDYVNTIKLPPGADDKKVTGIDTESALLAPERVRQVVEYTLAHFDQKTKRSERYTLAGKRLHGFNALFATASIDAAKRYYAEFKEQQRDRVPDARLKVGIIFSYAPNEAIEDGAFAEEAFETNELPADSRVFLDEAIQDYNQMFGTSFDTSADKFQNYYKDLSEKLKTRQIDLVIVVNMFLTGFDATTLNTLWVDKYLRSHSLIQAWSRTNRILNSVKTFGNIIMFRNLEQEANDAIALFGNKDAQGIVLLKPYEHYYADYEQKVHALLESFPIEERIVGESAQKAFITLFGAILKLQNILTSFDDFAGNEILNERQMQDYLSIYLNLYAEFRGQRDTEKESIAGDVVFEIELIKQVEVNVDYILMLVEKYRQTRGDGEDLEMRDAIFRAVDASPSLRNKRDLIEAFVDSVSMHGAIDVEWESFIRTRKAAELDSIIAAEHLHEEATRKFMEAAFRDGMLQTSGTAIINVLPPVPRFSAQHNHSEKKQRVLEQLSAFFERFRGLTSTSRQ